MSAPPYMKLYIGDYLGDTHHLSRGEHGAYLLLLMSLWRAGGKLPNDDSKLARLAKCTAEEWAEIGPTIREFFTVRGAVIVQKRATEEIAKYTAAVKGSKKGGVESGRKRANKNSDKDPNVRSQTVEPKSNQPEPEPERSSEDKSSGDVIAVSGDFDKDAWTCAMSLLRDQGGMPEKSARAFFGKLISANGLQARELLPTIVGAMTAATLDPQGYLTKAAAGLARRRTDQAPRRQAFV